MYQGRILLLGGNYIPEPTGIGKYNGEMMNWLSSQGCDCAVVTTYPYYPQWKRQTPYEKKSYWYSKEIQTQNGYDVSVYRCPHYIPKNPTGTNRMLSDISFFISAFLQLFVLLFHKKYDYVITVVPAFQLGLLGILYQRIKGAKFIYHIQDLQIDAAREFKMIKSRWLLKSMYSLERYILGKADHVSTISDGMILKVMQKCKKPVIFFPNWVDTKSFFPLSDRDRYKASFNIGPEEKVVLYSGAIGEKQGLESIIFAAEAMREHKIKFVICGCGPYKDKLAKLAERKALTNILFLPLQAKENFNEFLNMADIHLVLQKANANDLVMPSKLSTILAVGGLALVTASPKTSLYNIISRHDMGMLVAPEDQMALIDSIRVACAQSYESIQTNALRFTQEFLMIDAVINRFLTDIMLPKKSVSELTPELSIQQQGELQHDMAS